MQKLLRDNVVLIIGISLPVMLVIVFMLASTLPKLFVANPQYDFLFSDSQYNKVQFVVINQKIHFQIFPERHNTENQRLYCYVAATGKVQEIAFTPLNITSEKSSIVSNNINTNIVVSVDPHNLPSAEQARDVSKVVSEISSKEVIQSTTSPVMELAKVKIDNSRVAPDGYVFVDNGYGNGGGILFSAPSSDKSRVMISKSGRNIPILYNNSGNEYYRFPIFIGWIIP